MLVLGSVTVSIRVCLYEELYRIRSKDMLMDLICCADIHIQFALSGEGQ